VSENEQLNRAAARSLDRSLDRWQHRSRGSFRCSTCMWYLVKLQSSPSTVERPELGRCRRRAPTLGGWPAVFDDDWCGDHKLDENKF